MQVNRIQGNSSALNKSNNQIKSNSNPQNLNIGQTTNPLYDYGKCMSFGIIKNPLEVINIGTLAGELIKSID